MGTTTPRRRSSRLRGTPQRSMATPSSAAKLSSLVEREETPETEAPSMHAAATSPSKIVSSIPQPVNWSTPSSRKVLKPAFDEMHPSHAQSTAKKLASAKRSGIANAQTYSESRPSKPAEPSQPSTAQASSNPFSSPTFEFKFNRPSTDLSSDAKKLMDELRENAARHKTELAAQREKNEDVEMVNGRKIASAKGKIGRYSDIHMKDFKKMNSIADHPSSFRADPSRVATPTKSLKRSNSKAGLDKPELPSAHTSSSRGEGAASSPVKRQKARVGVAIPTKQAPSEESSKKSTPNTARPKSGIPGPAAFSTPTKSSLARSASTKTLMTGPSKIPDLGKSPSMHAFSTPQPPRAAPLANVTPPKVHTSWANKFNNGMKSILRRPQLRFSDDPLKIAAGTHVATPKTQEGRPLPSVPEATPGTPNNRREKHVEFSPQPDTVFKFQTQASSPAQPPTPSPAKPASSVVSLGSAPAYPSLPSASPTRASIANPSEFTFTSDKTISFSPKPTIRQVRASDGGLLARTYDSPTQSSASHAKSSGQAVSRPKLASFSTVPHGFENKKRKRSSGDAELDEDVQGENKENSEVFADALEDQGDEGPRKKARIMTQAEAKKPASAPATAPTKGKLSRLSTAVKAGAKGQKKSFLSKSRLEALARPKGK